MTTSVVLGGAGFLGSHLVDSLLSDGHTVIALDDLSSGKKKNLQHLESVDQFTFILHNTCNEIHLHGDIDYVFNFASLASPPRYLSDPIHTLKTGSKGTNNAIQLALSNGARLVHASTSEIYGDPQEHPQLESYWGHVNPIGPRSCYDEAKRYAEALCMAYSRTSELNVGIARIFNTYGPRLSADDGRVVSNLIVQALGGKPLSLYGLGQQTRSFCYVTDLIRGIRALAATDKTGPFNVGSPDEFTIRQLAELILEITGSSSELTFMDLPIDDPLRRRPDISLATEFLGWTPSVSLPDGIRLTVDWFRQQ